MKKFLIGILIIFCFMTFCVFYSRRQENPGRDLKKEIIISAKYVIRFIIVSCGAKDYEIQE